MYRVDEIVWDKTPRDTFVTKDGEVSFLNYYAEKYGQHIRDVHQPLILNKPRKGALKEIYLIPELCVTTGMTEEMRRNRDLMTALARKTKPNPDQRLREAAGLIRAMYNNEKTAGMLKEWKIKLIDEPISLTAEKLDAGNVMMV